MRKTFLTVFSILAISFTTNAQTPATVVNKAFYAEGGGPGILFSANFDSRFKKEKRDGFGFRVGLGFTIADIETVDTSGGFNRYDWKTSTIPTIPVAVNYLFAKPNNPNFFEVGAGLTFLTKKSDILTYNSWDEGGKQGNVMGNFSFMYRRQPVDGGFTWRIGFTPLINVEGDIVPFGAAGIGFSFK